MPTPYQGAKSKCRDFIAFRPKATTVVRGGTGPLLVPAEVVSPYCGTYLTLLMKTDRLFSLLEYQRLRGLITNTECDKEFARVDRLLKAVQRTALNLATGLRRRLNVAPARDGEATSPAGDNDAIGDGAKDIVRIDATGIES